MLDALQALGHLSAGLWPRLLQDLCLLLQHRQPHGDVKPIDQMLAKGMQILLHSADILTAIRHEHHLLILLHLAISSAPIIAVAVYRRRFERTRNTSPRLGYFALILRKATTLLP